MEHAHDHAHDHAPGAQSNRTRLLIVMACGLAVMAAEVVGGLAANSLVLLADAAHYATDVLAVGVAFLAITVAMRPATAARTFGYKRAEVLAAFVNAAALWGLSAYFLYEAYRRLRAPPGVDGTLVMAVGAFTLVANVLLALALRRGGDHNLNVKAAYLHILSDALGSAAALAAGALVRLYGWTWADPALTVFVTLLILVFTWRLTRETLHILLEGAPRHVDMEDLETTLRAMAPVQEIHELHVWSLSSGADVLSVHVVLDRSPQGDQITHDIHEAIRERFRIDHVTVQVESPDCPCEMARCGPAATKTA